MAELATPDARSCNYFFLYDGSKVKGEGDPTRDGICFFYPEETPVDKQELLCGQLAGVGRCVSELSSSPVRILRLRHNKYAVRMENDFFWALGCSVDVPTVSVCEQLDQLINLFRFYNGSVRQSYQLLSRDALAARWAQYLSHLRSGSSELQQIFSCVRTIDSTNVDPLLLLKAALILQACQRCPLVLAGCVLFRGRVVSTQMPPELTMKVMVHESESFSESLGANGPGPSVSPGSSVSSTTVFLTPSELQDLQSAPADKELSSRSTPHKETPPRKNRLSRTLSDTVPSESDSADPGFSPSAQRLTFAPCPSEHPALGPALSGDASPRPPGSSSSPRLPPTEAEEATLDESRYHSFHGNGEGLSRTCSEELDELDDGSLLNGAGGTEFDLRERETAKPRDGEDGAGDARKGGGGEPGPAARPEEPRLVPMTLYLHRVKSLVLALLVEPRFPSDTASMEEVYHSSLASLNGLEAHLRTLSPAGPAPPGPYLFAHFDRMQGTLTSNLSARPGGAPEQPFVRATSLLHSHFCNTETLQEAIIRSAGAAVYGSSSVAQETYFQQHGGSLRNSGIPNHQDSAFSLPSKARHRLLKHGVNLL